MMIWTAGIDLEVNEQQDMTSYVVHYQKKKTTWVVKEKLHIKAFRSVSAKIHVYFSIITFFFFFYILFKTSHIRLSILH